MYRTKYYRIISVVVVIAMLFTTVSVSAFANENVDNGLNEQLTSYQDFFEDMGYETTSNAKATKLTENFNVIIDDNTTNTVEKTILENGDVLCIITEGDMTNEMLITKEGKIYIDGSLITVAEDDGEFEPLIAEYSTFVPGVSTTRAQRYEFTKTCPYGSASDYTNSTTTKKVLSLGSKTFKSILQAAWVTIVGTALGFLSVPAGAIAGLGMSVALDYMKSKYPSKNAASLKDVRSVHKTKGFTVSSSMSVAKHTTTYYYNKDYTGIIKDSSGKSSFTGYEVYTY
ncbi:MAG: hypothetical protein ACLU83_07825 [Anaerovoracaceae bacterium]